MMAFSVHFSGAIVISDFCANAKPVIVDITVYKTPSNNFNATFVNYYLHCDLDQWNIDRHTSTVISYLGQLNSMFQTQLAKLSLVNQLHYQVNETYQALTCKKLNPIINQGLTQLCTEPVDGLGLISMSHLLSFTLFTILLFMVTFTL